MSAQQAGHGVAPKTVGFREALEVSGLKTEQSAAAGSHPQIVLRVLRQGGDAGVGQPVLLVVSMETATIKPREAAAIISRPKLAIRSGQYRHYDIVWKAVRFGKSSDSPILESNQAATICANPEIAVAVGSDGPRLDFGRHTFERVRGG